MRVSGASSYRTGVAIMVRGRSWLTMLRMNMLLSTLIVAAAALQAQPAPAGRPATTAAPALELSLMSFNIRYDTTRDGENRWEKRRELLVETIRQEDPDVVGLQEALKHQLEAVKAALPVYESVGVGRDDGKEAGEYSAILYRRDRLTPLESGTFWLSDTPAAPGSKSWGNNVVRVCTWARLKCAQSGREVWVYNTHLDHESQPSREKGLALVAERIAARAPGAPVVLMGDFNAGEENPALLHIKGKGENTARAPMVDTFRAVHPEEVEVGTFHGFKGKPTSPAKIDYIMVEPSAKVVSASINRHAAAGRYPSDHFPVAAKVRWE
jgi:endonuclease/exonuclease/phosphatase family metal-dependent hydrolase